MADAKTDIANAPSGSPMLSMRSVSKTFNKGTVTEKRALTDINLDLQRGDFVTVIGGNGAGKSTLLKIIVGEETPDEGEVTVTRGKTMGYLAQTGTLAGHRTIWDETAEVKRQVIEMEGSLRSMEERMQGMHRLSRRQPRRRTHIHR